MILSSNTGAYLAVPAIIIQQIKSVYFIDDMSIGGHGRAAIHGRDSRRAADDVYPALISRRQSTER